MHSAPPKFIDPNLKYSEPNFKNIEDGVLRDMNRIIEGFPLSLIQAAPCTPWFQDGGIFYGYNEDLVLILMGLVLSLLLDHLVVQRLFHPKGRYFALHAIINSIVVYYTFPDVVAVLQKDPVEAFFGSASTMIPNSFVCALHIYHCIAFQLNAEDIFHHLTFAFLLCAMAIPTKHISGHSSNFTAFFLSGLPGGLDYVMLVMQYHGVITRKQEKRWNTMINLYIRAPAMVICCFVGYTAWFNPGIPRPTAPSMFFYAAGITAPVFMFYNGQYYCRQTVESHHLFCLREADENKVAADNKTAETKKDK